MVEKQVVEPLEDNLKAVDGLKSVTSTASEGIAVVMASFDYGNESTKQLVADVQQAVNRARAQLPDTVDPQVDRRLDGRHADRASSPPPPDKDPQALADQLDRTVVPALQDIDGVGQVPVSGVQDLQVSVTPDERKLAAAGLNTMKLAEALRSGGATMPAGSFSEAGKSRTIQVGGGYTSLKQIEDLRIPAAAPGRGKAVRLGDVATVKQEESARTSLTRTNGKPSLAVMGTMDKDGSAVAISDAVEEKLPQLRRDLGAGAELTVVSDQGPAVAKAVSGLTTEGALGLVMAVLVILVFLASIRSTLVTAVSIPLSVVLALIVLWTRDLSLNMLTLGALTIAIGRVVDDSIVVLENIKRHLGYGEERQTAILTAVREVAGAVTSSTLTTVAVFLPIGLTGGMIGELFGSFSLTVTAALLASLLVSLTVVPVLSYWFLRAPKGTSEDLAEARRLAEEKEAKSRLQRLYVPVLRFATRRRFMSLAIALVVLVVTFGMAPLLKTNFFDQGEQEVLSIQQELAPGTSLSASDEAAKKIEKVLAETEGVKDYQVTVGSSGFMAAFGGATGSNQASYKVSLDDSAAYENDP
ncbi:efflux RND transporter permease subunit [Streptomyces tanashiensis]